MDGILKTLGQIAGDFSIVGILVLVAVAIGFFFGRTKLIALLIDLYIAKAIVSVVPASLVNVPGYSNAILFAVVLCFLLLVDRYLFDLHLASRGSDFFWRVGIMSLLTVGMFMSIFLSLLPKEVALDFMTKNLYSYFVSDLASFLWLVLPLIALGFMNRRLRD
jgi:hypothetical protein